MCVCVCVSVSVCLCVKWEAERREGIQREEKKKKGKKDTRKKERVYMIMRVQILSVFWLLLLELHPYIWFLYT